MPKLVEEDGSGYYKPKPGEEYLRPMWVPKGTLAKLKALDDFCREQWTIRFINVLETLKRRM